MNVLEATPLERQLGREVGVVVTIGTIVIEHPPLILQGSFRRFVHQKEARGTRRGHDANSGNVNPSPHC